MFMRLLFLLFITSSLPAVVVIQLSDQERAFIEKVPLVKVGVSKDWMPFNFVNDQGSFDGIAKDYLDLIAQKSGLHFEYNSEKRWNDTFTSFKEGNIDLLPALYYAKDRKPYGRFTDSYVKLRQFIFFNEERDDIHSLEDLEGLIIAIPKGYATIKKIKALHLNIKVLETNSIIESIQAVMSDKADALIEGQSVINMVMQQNMITGLKGIPQHAFSPSYIHMQVTHDKPELYTIIQKSLKAITQDERRHIRKKWSYQSSKIPNTKISFTKAQHQWMKEHPIINFTGDPHWLPFEAFDERGEYIGIVADLIDIIEERSNIRFNIITSKSWEHALSMLNDGTVDVLTETTDSSLRARYSFTSSFFSNPIVVIMDKESPYINSLHQLKDKRIVLIKDYGYTAKIKDIYPDLNFYEVDNITEGLMSVAEGKYDAILTTMALGGYHLRKLQLSNIKVVGKTEFSTQIGFAINREYEPLVSILNHIFKNITEKEKNGLLDKWVTHTYVEKTDYTLLWQILGGSLLLIFAALLWSVQLKKEIRRRTILEKELAEVNKKITDSIAFASIIQQAFLPEPQEFHGYIREGFALWEPRDIVGGDIYFFNTLEDQSKAILMVIDCTGHGVPGAFVTMLVKTLSRNFIAYINQNNEEVSPAKLLQLFNSSLKHLLKQNEKSSRSNAGFDAAFICIDKKRSLVRYAGANIPLFYTQDGRIKSIKPNRHSIGYKTSDVNYHFTDHEVIFDDAMQFYIATDGYIDQNGGDKGFPMGKKRFIKLLEENLTYNFKVQKENLQNYLKSWQGDYERNDDITVVGFKCKGERP